MNVMKVIVDPGVIPYEMISDSVKSSKYEIVFIGTQFQTEYFKITMY